MLLATRDPLVWLVCLEREVCRDLLEIREEGEALDHLGLKEQLGSKETEECRGLQDLLGPLEKLETKETQEHLDLLEKQEQLV